MAKCNERTLIYSRVVGYFSPVQQWNDGKRNEFKNRRVFKTNEYLNNNKSNNRSL